MCMTFTLTFTAGQGEKYTSLSKAFLFDSNSNVWHIGNHFQDIFCRNLHDIDVDLYNGSKEMFLWEPYAQAWITSIRLVCLFKLYLKTTERRIKIKISRKKDKNKTDSTSTLNRHHGSTVIVLRGPSIPWGLSFVWSLNPGARVPFPDYLYVCKYDVILLSIIFL